LVQAQAGGMQVRYVDQALYFDPDYAHRCGWTYPACGRPAAGREKSAGHD